MTDCFHCGLDDHLSYDCPDRAPRTRAPAAAQPPAAAGGKYPDGFRDHLNRIEHFVRQWQDGRITVDQKRREISDENLAFYGATCSPRLIWRD